MTAYGAVNSLRNTIDYILNSSHYSLVQPSPHIIQLAYQELDPLQEILEILDRTITSKSRKKVNGLDGRIKELIWEFQDLLESLLYQQILSQVKDEEMRERVQPQPQIIFQSPPPHHTTTTSIRRRLLQCFKPKGRKFKAPTIMNQSEASQSRSRVGGKRFSIDLQLLQQHVHSFIQRLKDLEEEYTYEVYNMPEDDGEQSIVSSRSGTKSKLIGLSDQFQQLKRELMECDWGYNYIVLTGTAGIGKTALAEAVFEDSEILSLFEHSVWVTVGRKFQSNDVSRAILAQMFGITQGDHELGAYLKGKKCLIVLDDVWETQILDSLSSSLRNNSSGSVYILVTARDRIIGFPILVRFLKEEESKELLCQKVFGEEGCPLQLDKAATKISKICEGLPLMIVTVADILSKAHNTDPKYWNDVAEMRNSVFTEAFNEISKVLFPSYDYLSQYLKMLFLYMGVYPSDYDIPMSDKIMNTLAIEGWFHNTNKKQSLKNSVNECLEQLCTDKNLVLFNERKIRRLAFLEFKTCRLHSSWRYVCRGEAQKNKFYHILKKLVEGLKDGVKGQRCLCLENNLLFSIKEFRNSVRMNCASSTRSLLFFGPYHQYPIPVGDDFKLLVKLDALNLRLYTFPTEILTLLLLKYLALTCNGELPATISKLFNLRVLIIHPHNDIRICGTPSYVPIEIWEMQELEHIEILGKSLVAPSHSASLEKLSTLAGVNASICTISEHFPKVPCIRKLGVRIELTPYDDHNDLLSCFGCISTLESLEMLKCSITNPVVMYDYVFPGSLMFPRGLKKLHLSGMGFSWEYMDVIGSLPFLRVLKLRAYAFRGPKWEAQEESFLKLRFLLIEDSDLVQWKPRSRSFPELSHLSMKHCYKLQEIHWFGTIELENCNPVALTWAKQFQPTPYCLLDVTATSSFDEKPTTIKFQRHGFEKWRQKDGDVKTES
ncbi:putative late blight resistance protein homolog R1C-3 isoform X2 [Salvia miltiorrhiza]|uniref:putative late blight resistance protein homolog R1C-3 isoform X1 n=1 Tax=Salvia miltiorrhiza TaxID=226208 RepID=UPI0025AC4539|nr:putative late blight resistance protein homolog R1C-3 isoform X1 [Salvia miltiorrhiza]XP_057789236.1 putative late blight resistance protein homolog R1C-3 isoform X1 [Salvia miltiorrhiza]XP_057789237.1 putative late blight resistance protein homolog R1C-3 isoform X2 [Salvia miltiorrhiza]